MKGRSALPRTAYLVGLLMVIMGSAGAIWGRRLLIHVPAFKVKQIEVVGTRLLAPDSVLHRANIDRERSVWQDFSPVAVELMRHPLIEEAEVVRSGLSTVRISVQEVEPLALVRIPELRPVREGGTVLPVDPWRLPLDLPVITAAAQVDSGSMILKDGPARRALETFSSLHELDPGLAALISDFTVSGSRDMIANLVASVPARRLALPNRIDQMLAVRVRATLADLRSRGQEATLIEARYANQIVVRLAEVQ